jgi:hypothetical protein
LSIVASILRKLLAVSAIALYRQKCRAVADKPLKASKRTAFAECQARSRVVDEGRRSLLLGLGFLPWVDAW